MTYEEALKFVTDKQSLGIKPGLARIKRVMNELSNPQDNLRIIHIAGTNGKGTVAATIAKAIIDSGSTVGVFSSPWVTDYRDQIQLNGYPVSESRFASLVELVASANGSDELTEFEFLTAMAYSFFNQRVTYAIIECGMGGREDSTNIEKTNLCSVLTSISLDHTAFLGETIEEITYQKEGIIREGSPCFRYVDTGFPDNDNLNLAKRVVRFLGIDDDISLVKPTCRQEKVGSILLDGGHNPAAGEALSNIISDEVAVIGMLRDKDVDGYLSFVARKCKKIYCTDINSPRALSAEKLKELALKYCNDVEIISDNKKAVMMNDVTLVCGSFYLLREVINLIKERS